MKSLAARQIDGTAMTIRNLSRILLVLGVALIVYSQLMEVSVGSIYGERIVNLDLLSRRQNLLILGGISLIAGVLLYATRRLKQTAQDEQEEKAADDAARRKDLASAKAAVEAGRAATGKVALGLRRYFTLRDDEVLSRIVTAVFVAASIFMIVGRISSALSWLILLVSVLYSLRAIPAARVKTHLLIVNIVVMGVVFLLAFFTWWTIRNEYSFSWTGRGVFALPLLISAIALWRVRRGASQAEATEH